MPIQSAESQRRAAELRRLQQEALSRLPVGGLYIVLFIRTDPHTPDSFHWGFYHHSSASSGYKYHITNAGMGWLPEHGPTSGLFKSAFLCCVIQISMVPAKAGERLDQIMRAYDGSLNQIPGVTCRVWLFKVLEMLIETGFVQCPDPNALYLECCTFGNQYAPSASSNVQPRPVMVSSTCN